MSSASLGSVSALIPPKGHPDNQLSVGRQIDQLADRIVDYRVVVLNVRADPQIAQGGPHENLQNASEVVGWARGLDFEIV